MTLYQNLIAEGCEIDHHESDLYVKVTKKALSILKKYPNCRESFRSQIDGSAWIDVPFAYEPFWTGKQ